MDHYQGSSAGLATSFLTAGGSSMVDVDSAVKIWNYIADLTKHLYEVRPSSRTPVSVVVPQHVQVAPISAGHFAVVGDRIRVGCVS